MTVTPAATSQDLFKRISSNGINVDLEGLVRKTRELQAEELEALEDLDVLTEFSRLRKDFPASFKFKKGDPERFNPRSRIHLTAYFMDKGEDPPHSFSMDALEPRLSPDMFDVVVRARRLREFWGDLGTLRKFMGVDCKIHVEWTEAKTGRFYTGKPPIQTMAKVCREYLVPDEGNVFSVIDWRQQELRLLAKASGEPVLLNIFEKGEDPHLGAYKAVTGKDGSEDPAFARDIGKMLNYALIYGLEAQGLGSRLRIPNDKAQLLINAYFNALPTLAGWREQQKAFVKENGFVTTLAGREIPVDGDADNWRERQSMDRKAINYKIQGSAADQMLFALAGIAEIGYLDNVRAQMHDAFLIEAPAPTAKMIAAEISTVMEQPYMNIATPVEIKGPAQTWREAMDMVDTDEPEAA